jgi:hypothetical protein
VLRRKLNGLQEQLEINDVISIKVLQLLRLFSLSQED